MKRDDIKWQGSKGFNCVRPSVAFTPLTARCVACLRSTQLRCSQYCCWGLTQFQEYKNRSFLAGWSYLCFSVAIISFVSLLLAVPPHPHKHAVLHTWAQYNWDSTNIYIWSLHPFSWIHGTEVLFPGWAYCSLSVATIQFVSLLLSVFTTRCFACLRTTKLGSPQYGVGGLAHFQESRKRGICCWSNIFLFVVVICFRISSHGLSRVEPPTYRALWTRYRDQRQSKSRTRPSDRQVTHTLALMHHIKLRH